MRLGIIQLSDIHFKNTDVDRHADSELAQQICSAITTELIGTTHIILVVSGDIAFSGLPGEYERAGNWFTELYTLLDDACNASCTFLYSPGNHDVDHTDKRKTRIAVIDQIKIQPQYATEADIIRECTIEQEAFFSFRNALESPGSIVFDDLLLRVHRIHHDTGAIQINMLNTAWMSEMEERQGSLIFPIEQYAEQLKTSDGFTIAVLHHPLNWFEPENARALREELLRNSSIVCFGHEHMPDSKRGVTSHGDHVLYVDGGVLNETDEKTRSSFNLIVLDVDSSEIRHIKFERNDARFVPENPNDMEWQDATKLLGAESSHFRLKESARTDLGNIGLNVLHPRRNDLHLRDLFVYPDMLPLNQREAPAYERLERTITSEQIIYEKTNRHVILEGEEKTGKSALLRMLFSEFYNRGKIPILLNGNKININSLETIRRSIRKIFRATYDDADFLQFDQLNPIDRVILIDDLRFDERGTERMERLFQFLLDYSGYAVVTTDTFMAIEELLVERDASMVFQKYGVYSIQEFGHQRRNDLIGKWLQLGQTSQGWDTPSVLEDRDAARKTIDTVIGRNFVPSTPTIVLVILQSISSGLASTIGSTYGDYYQFLITRSLMHAGVRPEDLDAYLNYVTELAHKLYENGRELTEDAYYRWHLQYCEDYAIEWRHNHTKSTLSTATILEELSSGLIQFRFPYIYYFFLARYISRKLTGLSMREQVGNMCQRLHVSEYANVILFLIHHSDNSFVLDSLRSATASLMHGKGRFRFEIEIDNDLLSWINSLPSDFGKRSLEDRDPEVEQRRELRQKDIAHARERELERMKSREEQIEHRPMSELGVLGQGLVSGKAIELLGQVLKNYYGSLIIDTKLGVAEEAVEVGLRALYLILDLCLFGEKKIIDSLVAIRREYEINNVNETSRKNDSELTQWARNTLFSVIRSVASAVILKVSRAVSARQLRRTLTKLAERNESIAYGFIELAALLDSPENIPRQHIDRMAFQLKNNVLGTQILQDLVSRRVYRYPTSYGERQWLAKKLGFSLVKQRVTDIDQSRRLLPKKS